MKTAVLQKDDKKIINSWCLYDWANSAYSLTIATAIFPIYYRSVAVAADGGDTVRFFGLEVVNSVLYSYALSGAFLVVALVLPVLSGIADYSGKKRFFLKMFMFTGSFACIGLSFFTGNNIEWGIMCAMLAGIGYSGSLVFYDAFLPEIASEEKRDMVSARGYAYGYIGSVILLIVNLVIIENFGAFGFADKKEVTRFAFMTVGVWWIGFSLYAIGKFPVNVHNRKPEGHMLSNGYKELGKVWKKLKTMKDMRFYLFSFFFYNAGTQTVMYMATLFALKELKIGETELIATVLGIQFLATIGAYLFANVSKRRGNISAIMIMILIWIGCCVCAFFITKPIAFYALASVVGTIMGGIQALSRATFSKIMPKDTIDTASFFSLYDVTFNVSIVFGMLIYGLVEQVTGSMRNSTLVLVLLFILGILFLSRVKLKNATAQPS